MLFLMKKISRLTKSDWIKNDNDITYVNRARNARFPQNFKRDLITSNNVNATFIGYTHFGYGGFFWKKKTNLIECILDHYLNQGLNIGKIKNLERNIKEIKKIIDNNKIRSITLKNLVKDK